jgi:hypothetical protein
MSKHKLQKRDLKDRLDVIDAVTKLKGAAKVGDLWRLEKLGMWRKGLEVLRDYPELESDKLHRGGRGVYAVSYRMVGRMSGRHDMTVRKWVNLVKHVGRARIQFDRWAKLAVPEVVERWSKGLPAKADWKTKKLKG